MNDICKRIAALRTGIEHIDKEAAALLLEAEHEIERLRQPAAESVLNVGFGGSVARNLTYWTPTPGNLPLQWSEVD